MKKEHPFVKEATKLTIHPLIKEAIYEAIKKALRAEPTVLHTDGQTFSCFQIGKEIYDAPAAVEEIMGEYSWWKELAIVRKSDNIF
jgi:hypothetical protein